VLGEELVAGEDLRVVVIGHQVVAAALRRPAEVVGDGRQDVAALVQEASNDEPQPAVARFVDLLFPETHRS
jgi:D-alanine-D-alanine ligase-like ATP-grasp enzyme